MAVPADDLKFALANAAIEAANDAKNAINLAVAKGAEAESNGDGVMGHYAESSNIATVAQQCAQIAKDMAEALAAVEERFPSA